MFSLLDHTTVKFEPSNYWLMVELLNFLKHHQITFYASWLH